MARNERNIAKERRVLLHAIHLIETNAKILKESCTWRGRWPMDDPGAKVEHDDMVKTAQQLRALCRDLKCDTIPTP